MYSIDWTGLFARSGGCPGCGSCLPADGTPRAAGAVKPHWIPRVNATVWALGFTSLFTDISSEMVASVLPMYLVVQLGVTPLAFGFIDGVYQGIAALVRVAGGLLGDRWRRHKELAAVGYGLSALSRLLILPLGTAWAPLAGAVAVDRLGKGIRTAPRDALIATATARCSLATAFGVHRSLDAIGAMLGPVVAFALLSTMPNAFDTLFVVSFAIAVIGLAVIILFVNAPSRELDGDQTAVTLRAMFRLALAPQFARLLLVGFVLGLTTISDSFLFLTLQRQLDIGAPAFPLLYVATSLFTSVFAVPFGRLADRIGRPVVLLGGYVLLSGVYAIVLAPGENLATAGAALALLGGYYAATDGVLTALAASSLPPQVSGSGLAMLATVTNLSRFLASSLFGLLWTVVGVDVAVRIYLAGVLVAIAVGALLLRRSDIAREFM